MISILRMMAVANAILDPFPFEECSSWRPTLLCTTLWYAWGPVTFEPPLLELPKP